MKSLLFVDRAPKDVKLYIDKTSPGFEDLRGAPCTQELHFNRDEIQQGLPTCLRFVRFQRVHSLHVSESMFYLLYEILYFGMKSDLCRKQSFR